MQKIEAIIDENESDWWNEISSSEKENLDIAIRESDKTDGIPHAQVMEKHSKWL